ncbi:divergent polysaccharide deacetylase family protein [Dichotomicrobium thermohalophilum]|uniref:Polysaccharide deacetylase 2 family uncharacterized protein YibQ n=1 Tax=Dichotomicrobium thermohalophilum TaxID=933063 RepID=A0A397QDY3_9HYPH|nr:divergent polysaccharide deacetylase family protein [Dichotomicrobium thermohalophilum]RIA56284.1 polysaccharide deacetylase 2 family uncharacterized protein YibQ [Dichotomicrobium thermohalophilum]
MRALLFTAFGVIVAATAGVSYLALSPAPDQSSDSLKLVIETGSIPATRQASDTDDGNVPTGSLSSEPASGENDEQPSLDEVIAARLKQTGKGDETEPSAPDNAATQPSTETAAAPSPAAETAAPDETAPPDETGGSETAEASAETGFEAPDNASPPPGTVSITQMLAAELNKDGDASTENTAEQEPARQAADARSAENDTATAETSEPAQPTSDSIKTAGRLPQAGESARTAQPPNNAATLTNAETSPQSGAASETEIAALEPQTGDTAPDTQAAETTAPEVTQEQPPAEPQDTAAQAEQPASEPQPLAAADAPALPGQRGTFSVKGRIALIIRGLGVKSDLTEQTIGQMPQQVAMAFVPYGEDLKSWTQRAQADRHDILIQIPLEPKGYPENNPGPHTLLTSLSIDENLEHLDWLLDRFDGITGVTNYMGGKFASSPGSFAPMLMELKARNLLYVDDSKAANATTRQLARQVSLAYSVADVVIDTKREPEAIQKKLAEVEAQARQDGSAIAIGHAHAATLAALQNWIGSLNEKGLALVPITELTTAPTPRVSQSTGG